MTVDGFNEDMGGLMVRERLSTFTAFPCIFTA